MGCRGTTCSDRPSDRILKRRKLLQFRPTQLSFSRRDIGPSVPPVTADDCPMSLLQKRLRTLRHPDRPKSSGDRLLAVLSLFTVERPQWTVEDAAERLSVSATTTYRYFKRLTKAG